MASGNPNFKMLRDLGYRYSKVKLDKVPPVDGALAEMCNRSDATKKLLYLFTGRLPKMKFWRLWLTVPGNCLLFANQAFIIF